MGEFCFRNFTSVYFNVIALGSIIFCRWSPNGDIGSERVNCFSDMSVCNSVEDMIEFSNQAPDCQQIFGNLVTPNLPDQQICR